MRSRKKELEELVQLLDSDHDDVESLADAVWKLVDSHRKVREAWVIVVNHGHPLYLAYGLYDTVAAAQKDLGKYKSTTGNERAYIVKAIEPSLIFEQDEFMTYK